MFKIGNGKIMNNSQTDLNGNKIWTDKYGECWFDSDGEPHRVDGPAYISSDGYQAWYIHGQRHRVDGPAIVWHTDVKEYFYKGCEIEESVYYSSEFQVKMVMES